MAKWPYGMITPDGVIHQEETIEVTCTEAQWRATPEAATQGRRCLRCIARGSSPPGRARFTHRHGSLCNFCYHHALEKRERFILLERITDDEG